MKNLTIDAERLWADLMETAAIGATSKGGICRLTLTDLDRQVRDWFAQRAEALGCVVTVDDMGSMFARWRGQRSDIPPIAIGSHLDTQPSGENLTVRSAFLPRWKLCGHCVALVTKHLLPLKS